MLIHLFTGGRSKRNTAAMRWDEIRWDRSVWVILAWKFKNGEEEENLLIPEVVSLLQHRRSRRDADPVWVFPGCGKTGHLVEPKSAWKRILKRAGVSCGFLDLDFQPADGLGKTRLKAHIGGDKIIRVG